MIQSRISFGFAAVLLGTTLFCPQAAGAQPPVEAGQATGAAATQNAQPRQAPPIPRDAEETRRAFYQVLDEYPPALGYVLRLDPTLLSNASYLSSYPRVAEFVAQAPDVPRNPGYYLSRYDPNSYSGFRELTPQQQAIAMWDDVLEFVGAFLVFAAVAFGLFHFLKYIVEYRRWHRVSKQNAEVHNKILDRFGSNEELLAYIDSPAGRRFLEATPIAATAAPPKNVGAPFGRILLSVQVGMILLALGLGFLIISWDAIEEVRPILTSLAVLGFALGIGSIGSGAASYVISRRLGLLQQSPPARPEPVA